MHGVFLLLNDLKLHGSDSIILSNLPFRQLLSTKMRSHYSNLSKLYDARKLPETRDMRLFTNLHSATRQRKRIFHHRHRRVIDR